MQNIQIEVRNLIAAAKYGERIVSDNAGYTITFDFDEEWNDTDRTARFIFDSGYIDVPFSGDTVFVPMLPASVQEVKVGVYSGSLQTTTAAAITVVPSCLGSDDTEYIPATDTGIPDAADLAEEDTLRIYDKSAGKLVKATLKKLGEAIGGEGGGGTGSGLTYEQINALDEMFKITAFSSDPTSAYNAFKVAFGISNEEPGKTLSSISVTYLGGNVVTGTPLTDLTGITVTAIYSDGSTETVTGYTLSGEILEGDNIITVSYSGLTNTFTVTGVTESGGDIEELPTDGLKAYFDFRNMENSTGNNSTGYYLYPQRGDGSLYSWHQSTGGDDIGMSSLKILSYSENSNTTPTSFGTEFTWIAKSYCAAESNIPVFANFALESNSGGIHLKFTYKKTDGTTGTVEHGDALDRIAGYKIAVIRVSGSILSVYLGNASNELALVCECDGSDIEDFANWDNTLSKTVGYSAGGPIYAVSYVLYTKALTDVEITNADAFLKTLEVA